MSKPFDPQLIEFVVRDLRSCSTPDALVTSMVQAAKLVGAANFSYYSDQDDLPRPSDRSSFFTYGGDWSARYLAKEYDLIDPVVVEKPWPTVPIDWMTLRARRPGLDWLFREAASYGVGTQGITIPVRDSAGEGVFSITTYCSAQEWQKTRWIYCAFGAVFAMHFHEMVLSLNEEESDADLLTLSDRQIQCLRHFGWGYSPKEIAARLAISDTMVRKHLHACKTKLQCSSVIEAVARAASLRLIHPRPLDVRKF